MVLDSPAPGSRTGNQRWDRISSSPRCPQRGRRVGTGCSAKPQPWDMVDWGGTHRVSVTPRFGVPRVSQGSAAGWGIGPGGPEGPTSPSRGRTEPCSRPRHRPSRGRPARPAGCPAGRGGWRQPTPPTLHPESGARDALPLPPQQQRDQKTAIFSLFSPFFCIFYLFSPPRNEHHLNPRSNLLRLK